ncbi:TRAP transporter small permease [Aquibaculum sediminis]|uniref:TRAP transporter small permease n=1 Tax=Aquibaculum sediminis TaxID=3231907 RepID=UPI003455723E
MSDEVPEQAEAYRPQRDRNAASALARFCSASEAVSVRLLGLLLAGMVLIMLVAVWTRYVANAPLVWTEQVNRILFVWTTFLGAAVLYRRSGHIAIDFFVELLPPALRRTVQALNALLLLVLFLVLLVYGWNLAWANLSQTFGALDISPSTFYFAAPVSAALMLVYWIERAIEGVPRLSDTSNPGKGGEGGS